MNWGDYQNTGQTEEFGRDATLDQNGEPATVTGGALAVHRLGTAAALAVSVGYTADYYGTGDHRATIDFSHASMATAGSFKIKWTAGTCDGVSLVGRTFCEFSHGRYATPEEFLEAAVPEDGAAGSVAECLAAARAQGFGRWSLDEGTEQLTLYGADDTTPIKVFNIGPSLSAPLTRTPE